MNSKLLIELEKLNIYRTLEYDDFFIVRKSKLANESDLISAIKKLIRVSEKVRACYYEL